MNETSTYLFIYENDGFNVTDVLFPVYDHKETMEAFLPMEKPSEEAVIKLLSRIDNLWMYQPKKRI